jgi:hypothetical protein
MAAILIAPWAVVPIVALAAKGGPHLGRLELIISGIFVGTLFAVPLAYLAVLVVGYPAYKFLKCKGILNAWSLSAVGVVAGGLGGLAIAGPEALILCATSGFAVAITAWLIIRNEHLMPQQSNRVRALRAPDSQKCALLLTAHSRR